MQSSYTNFNFHLFSQNIPCTQSVPGSIYVCVEVLLSWLASADAIAWVVVRKDVAVDSVAEANVETAHLAKVNSVSMREQHCKSERRQVSWIGGQSSFGIMLVCGALLNEQTGWSFFVTEHLFILLGYIINDVLASVHFWVQIIKNHPLTFRSTYGRYQLQIWLF